MKSQSPRLVLPCPANTFKYFQYLTKARTSGAVVKKHHKPPEAAGPFCQATRPEMPRPNIAAEDIPWLIEPGRQVSRRPQAMELEGRPFRKTIFKLTTWKTKRISNLKDLKGWTMQMGRCLIDRKAPATPKTPVCSTALDTAKTFVQNSVFSAQSATHVLKKNQGVYQTPAMVGMAGFCLLKVANKL